MAEGRQRGHVDHGAQLGPPALGDRRPSSVLAAFPSRGLQAGQLHQLPAMLVSVERANLSDQPGDGDPPDPCWRRFGPISLGPRSTAKAIARSTPGFGSWTGSESPARGCCASCGRTDCSPRTAGRQGAAKTHDGRVITQAPNVMWGTDGVRVFTLDDGWGWIFAAVEHWNAECVGWHVCKVGSRFAALDPIAQGLDRRYGSLDTDVARGLALRMDHGTQYLSDHFLKQIRYWGIHPSFGFVEEPETNGVAERWNRTLKEQAIHGRIFQNLEAIRAAVADFVERYNQTWRLEKLGYHTPIEAREEYELRQAA